MAMGSLPAEQQIPKAVGDDPTTPGLHSHRDMSVMTEHKIRAAFHAASGEITVRQKGMERPLIAAVELYDYDVDFSSEAANIFQHRLLMYRSYAGRQRRIDYIPIVGVGEHPHREPFDLNNQRCPR